MPCITTPGCDAIQLLDLYFGGDVLGRHTIEQGGYLIHGSVCAAVVGNVSIPLGRAGQARGNRYGGILGSRLATKFLSLLMWMIPLYVKYFVFAVLHTALHLMLGMVTVQQ